jgi:UDP-glucose 4-epimerase
VLDVIETVKRISGVDFNVELADRRAGDPAQVVAAAERIRSELGWHPQYDDLSTIIAHALKWEDALRDKGNDPSCHVFSN